MNGKIVLVSALLYSISFLWMEYFFWLMIPALLMLVYAFMYANSARQGLVWGLVVYGVHCGLLMYGVYQIRPSWLLLVGWLGFVVYLALYFTAVFFLGSCFLPRIRSMSVRVACAIMSLSFCFFLIDRYSFCIFGVEGGYCLANPLLPLVYGVEKYVRADAVGAGCFPGWVDQVALIRTRYAPCAPVNTHQLVQEFFAERARQLSCNSRLRLVVTPESAFPCVLNKDVKNFAMISDNSLGMHFIVGGFFQEGDRVSNGFYWFVDGQCKHFCAKRHAIPFVEMMPSWCDFPCVRRLFLDGCSKKGCTDISDAPRATYELLPGVFFYPVICSEVFCAGMLARVPPGAVALVLVNDAWFAHVMLVRAAYLYVMMQAWWYNVSIVYVSYRYDFCRIVF